MEYFMAGLLLGGIFLIGMQMFCALEYVDWTWRMLWLVIAIAVIGFGAAVDYYRNRTLTESFLAAKATIEESVTAPELSGLERLKLVEQATTLNGTLAARKFTRNQWYGFLEDPRLSHIEPILLGNKNER